MNRGQSRIRWSFLLVLLLLLLLFFSPPFFHFAAAVNLPKKERKNKKPLRSFGECFGSADFWPLLGYALGARWAFSSTTKAGFKKLYQAAQTNPLHPLTNTHTHPQSQVRAPSPCTGLGCESGASLGRRFCGTLVHQLINKSTWGHVGR